MRDRSRSAGAKAHGIAAKLRSRAQLGRDEIRSGVQRITGEVADVAPGHGTGPAVERSGGPGSCFTGRVSPAGFGHITEGLAWAMQGRDLRSCLRRVLGVFADLVEAGGLPVATHADSREGAI